ncbi:MAG: P-loop NTPase, partial [Planctomycetota bacterium]|nr:P-loop NTPase [Planctomycetota bacterium]
MESPELPPCDPLAAVRARSLCIVSGKGGTGKSTLTASLASSFEHHGRALLVDADLGVGNAHLFCDLQPKHTLVDVVSGTCSALEAVVSVRGQLDLLAGGSGCLGVASLDQEQMQ